MKHALVVCALAFALSCKREEDAPSAQTQTAIATTTAAATGPTQLVALTQPQASDYAASTAPTLTPTLTPTPTQTQTPTPTRSALVAIGNVSAAGLPAESVRRVANQNVARYRQCYDAGLRGNPALHGKVVARITIDASGSIMSAEDGGSDLPDATVTSCVFGTLGNLSFPQPEAGSATATVPIVFSPPS